MVIPAAALPLPDPTPFLLAARDGVPLSCARHDGKGPGVLLAHGFGQTRLHHDEFEAYVGHVMSTLIPV
jgi:hypothetical protein